jgi:hypothetical protein
MDWGVLGGNGVMELDLHRKQMVRSKRLSGPNKATPSYFGR